MSLIFKCLRWTLVPAQQLMISLSTKHKPSIVRALYITYYMEE